MAAKSYTPNIKGENFIEKKPGRPSVITPEVVSILITSFHYGLTIREACWQSDISHEAYYSRLRNDAEFADIMSKAQSNVTIKAKQIVISAINGGDLGTAKWWLERKTNDEFSKNATNPISDENTLEEREIMTEEEVMKLKEELRSYFSRN